MNRRATDRNGSLSSLLQQIGIAFTIEAATLV
jgi:hypothetical protein